MMKFQVIEQTSNHLIFQTKRLSRQEFIVGYIICGLGFPIFFFFMSGANSFIKIGSGFFLNNPTKTLTCEKVQSSQINCVINESSDQILVNNLQEARVYHNVGINSNEVVLLTKKENIVFSHNINHASQVNNFIIDKSKKNLQISDANYFVLSFLFQCLTFWPQFLVGLIFVLWSTFIFFMMRHISRMFINYKFDKSKQIVSLKGPSFMLRETTGSNWMEIKIYEYEYSGILGFCFEKNTDSEGDTYYQVCLKTTEGKNIFAAFAYKEGILPDPEDREIINTIMEYGIKGIFNLPNSETP